MHTIPKNELAVNKWTKSFTGCMVNREGEMNDEVNLQAPQEGDCHGNMRAQRKRGTPRLPVTDSTRCTHTLEAATNTLYRFVTNFVLLAKIMIRVELQIITRSVTVQGKCSGRAWNSHAH
jgi:hypothetical protein